MEIVRNTAEKLITWLRQRQDPTHTFWTCQQFEDYIKSLAKGSDALAFSDDFPRRIALYRTWHEVFNTLRAQAASEGRERWAMIGFKADRSRVYLQTNGSLGSEGSVSHTVRQKTIDSAKQKGIVGLIGSIHSHPGASNFFSAEDLFTVVVSKGESITAVAEPSANLFAFRSFDSVSVPSGPFGLTQQSFAKYWYEQCGYKVIRSNHQGTITTPSLYSKPVGVNKAIAQKHKLVIYSGLPNRHLTRIYP